MECINFNNKLYFIKKNLNENKNDFIKRYWYIINSFNSEQLNNKSFEHIINLSNIYINELTNKCVYKY
jgi:hypothetical protein